ncbi:hypothetical protein [Maricaulis salignorans]|uniref:hypothetical protein n=1 Tax=Maricaulis salignorans TaxID=144026 RepID=UPI003A9302FC
MKHYARTLFIALFTGLLGFAGFNALIDPFGVTGAPDIPGLTARDTRLYGDGGRVHVGDRLARGGDASILLGSSRTVDGFPHEPTGWPGEIYNAGMRGTNIFELSQAMALAARNAPLRCVVIGLDLDEFGTHSRAKATYWLSTLNDGNRALSMTRVSLSPNTFGASLQLLADNIGGGSPRVPWADTYPAGAQRERYESGVRGIYGFYLGYNFDAGRVALFERALDALTENGIQVIGFIHPLHAWREEALFRSGRSETYFEMRQALTEVFDRHAAASPGNACVEGGGAVLWDFSGFRDFASLPAPGPEQTDAHPNFYEPSHYLPHIGQAMLDSLRGDASTPGVSGVRLEPGNLAASAGAIRTRRQSWLETEDGQAATALFDALEAAGPQAETETPQFLNRDDRRSLEDKISRIAPGRAER